MQGMENTETAAHPPVRRHLLPMLVAVAVLAFGGCGGQQVSEGDRATALRYFHQGNEAMLDGHYRIAIRRYTRAVESDPTSADSYYNLGLAQYNAGLTDDAVQSYLKALELRPEFPEAHLNVALAFNRLYQLDQADNHYVQYQQQMGMRQAASQPRISQQGAPQQTGATPQGGARQQTVRQPVAMGGAAGGATGGAAPVGQSPVPAARAKKSQSVKLGVMPPGQENPYKGVPKWWTQAPTPPNQ